jgi:nucleoside-diphosphate-sugar epimerase
MDAPEETKKIAIVGASGFIGSAIYRKLKATNYEVAATSRSIFQNNEYSNNFKVDLFDKSTWDFLLTKFKPDIVICAAWDTEHNKYWHKDTNFHYMQANIEFAAACLTNGVNKFIGIGTMSEYGFSPGKCNSKTTQLNPQDAYSEAKVLTSISIKKIAADFGKKANWVRLFQPYGEKEKPERLIPTINRSMKQNTKVTIKYPNHSLDFTSITDIADALKYIVNNDIEYDINIGTGTATSIRDLCKLLAEINNYSLDKVIFDESNSNSERIIYVDPNSDFLSSKWKYTCDLSSGLRLI